MGHCDVSAGVVGEGSIMIVGQREFLDPKGVKE
jgi:hypothetical protein